MIVVASALAASPGIQEMPLGVLVECDEFNTADYLDTYSHCKRLDSKFQPNEYLMIENVGRSNVMNPRFVINGRRNWYSVETILSSILSTDMTDAEKAMAIWNFSSSIEVQCHDNNRRETHTRNGVTP